MASWTISINGGSAILTKYVEIHRKLVLNTPTTFTATIKYDVLHPVHYLDQVQIYRNGIINWQGYIEDINPHWDDSGQYLNIGGRDATLILHKKFTDDFSNFAQKTAGFFGKIDPIQLLRFILHTPKSDIGVKTPYNKEGWGIDFSTGFGRISQSVANPRDVVGNESWVISRQRGYGWFNSGRPEFSLTTGAATGGSLETYWSFYGIASFVVGNSPNQSSYANYVTSINGNGFLKGTSAIFNFSPFNLTGINISDTTVTISYNTGSGTLGNFNAAIWSESVGDYIPFASNIGGTTGNWVTKTFNITQILKNISDLHSSNLKIKITTSNPWDWLPNTTGVSIAFVGINITKSAASNGNQTTNDQLIIPLISKGVSIENPLPIKRVITALYFECRADTNTYPRNFTVEYSDNAISWTQIPNASPSLPVRLNITSDILISFPPISTNYIRMRLTDNSSLAAWGVSQVYVYLAENLKYKAFLDVGELDYSLSYPYSPTTAPVDYIYAGGPYIKAFNNIIDQAANPIGPINVSRQRLLDAINYIVGLCSSIEVGDNNVVGFKPMEWWLSFDSNNTFNLATQKGSDKSESIKFISGEDGNIGACDFKTYVGDTIQKLYVIGHGEQKNLEDTSLWVKAADAEDGTFANNGQALSLAENIVRTFYEDTIQDKTVIIDDNDYPSVGNMIGSANLSRNAMPRVQLIFKVTKDTFSPVDDKPAYDVGDLVQLIDQKNGIGPKEIITNHNIYDLTEGIYRIQNIDIVVQEGYGEDITVTLGYPNYKFQDELQKLYTMIQTYGRVGCFNSDWTAEGTDKTLVDAKMVSSSSQYSVNAQNDKIAQTVPYDGNCFSTTDRRIDSSPPTISTNTSNNFLWSPSNTYFGMQATRDNYSHLLQAILLGNLVGYYDQSANNGNGAMVNGADAADISMLYNPHLSMDVKCCDGVYTDLVNSQWTYDHWNIGDYSRVGISTADGTYGFWFMFIKRTDSPTALFDVYAQWALSPSQIHSTGLTNISPSNFNALNNTQGGVNSPNGAYLTTITPNKKYKIEIITQCDPTFIATSTPNVKFNLYEYKTAMQTTSDGLNLNYIQLTYPTMGIITDPSIYFMSVKPLSCIFYNSHHGNSSNLASVIYFYNFATNWTVKQINATL